MRHVVYRFYDEADDLLYVGLSMNVPLRFASHRDDKPWWIVVRRITLQPCLDRGEARVIEAKAIQEECPKHNIQRPTVIRPPQRERDVWDGQRLSVVLDNGVTPMSVHLRRQQADDDRPMCPNCGGDRKVICQSLTDDGWRCEFGRRACACRQIKDWMVTCPTCRGGMAEEFFGGVITLNAGDPEPSRLEAEWPVANSAYVVPPLIPAMEAVHADRTTTRIR
jgi:RNA polymerase subunit RPABC4/transcription elongation factor Spt4